jgi:hypothetical protein
MVSSCRNLEKIEELQAALIRKEIYLSIQTALLENETESLNFAMCCVNISQTIGMPTREQWEEMMGQSVVEIDVICELDRIGLDSRCHGCNLHSSLAGFRCCRRE